jgi:GAF domain-containing protein
VHSKLAGSFSSEQMEVLQAMADQVALAIENARLYSESLQRLAELEQARQRSTIEAWHHYVRGLRARRLESTVGVMPSNEQTAPRESLREDALAEGRVVVGDPTERDTIPLVVPIRLRGQLLGAVEWEVPQDEFDLNKIQLAQNLTDQLAVNLENARLFQESQRATQRERLVNEIASRLTSQNDIDHILQTAVREVGMALRSPQVSVRLSQTSHSNGSNGHKVADVDDETQSRSESI